MQKNTRVDDTHLEKGLNLGPRVDGSFNNSGQRFHESAVSVSGFKNIWIPIDLALNIFVFQRIDTVTDDISSLCRKVTCLDIRAEEDSRARPC